MSRTTRWTVVAVLSLSATVALASPAFAATGIIPGHASAPSGGTTTLGAQIDSGNTGSQLAETFGTSITKSWSAEPPLCPEAANDNLQSVSVTGSVSIALDRQYQCSYLSAYGTSTGKLLWRRYYYFALKAVAANGLAYVLYEQTDGADSIDAISISTGAVKWTVDGIDMAWPNLALGSGLLVNGQLVYNASTGALVSVLPLSANDEQNGASIVTGGRIYYSSPNTVEAFTSTGARIWSTPQPAGWYANSGEDVSPQVSGGRIFTLSGAELNASNGKLIRMLPTGASPIAIDGTTAFISENSDLNTPGLVEAVSVTTGTVLWKHTLAPDSWNPTQLPSPTLSSPVVENGVVWLNTMTDTTDPTSITVLDEVTGALKESIATPCAAGSNPGALVIAQHRLFPATGCGVVSYVNK